MVPVRKGDLVFVAAGTVHALLPGVVMLETQQTSDLTYRMYDYGSSRELHLEKAFAAMRLVTMPASCRRAPSTGTRVLIDERYFRIEKWPVGAGTAACAGCSGAGGADAVCHARESSHLRRWL